MSDTNPTSPPTIINEPRLEAAFIATLTPNDLLARLTRYRETINDGKLLSKDSHHNALLILRALRYNQQTIATKKTTKKTKPATPTLDLDLI